jgi:hypothetical protein
MKGEGWEATEDDDAMLWRESEWKEEVTPTMPQKLREGLGCYYSLSAATAGSSASDAKAKASAEEEATVDAESVVAAERPAAAFESAVKTCAIAALHFRCW